MENDKMDKYLMQTVRFLEIFVPINVLNEIKKSTCEELAKFNFGFGIWIRNNILNETSIIYNCFICTGVEHPDDMSFVIIEKFHQYLNQKFNSI